MMKKTAQKGFTLLELLLVVGIAAILIVAGITTYSLVNKSNSINETVRLANTILDSMRRLYAGQNTYGVAATSSEALLYNTGSVPEKFKSATAGTLVTPYATDANAIAVTGHATAGLMTVAMNVPPAYAPEIAANFDPNTSNEITGITVCGTVVDDGTALNVATLSATCGNTTTVPTAAGGNFIIRSR